MNVGDSIDVQFVPYLLAVLVIAGVAMLLWRFRKGPRT